MAFLYVYHSFCCTVKVEMTAIRQILCRVCFEDHVIKILHSIHRGWWRTSCFMQKALTNTLP